MSKPKTAKKKKQTIEVEVPEIFPLIKGWFSKINVTHVILLSFALHAFCMCFPSEGGMVFDEVHYVRATEGHLLGIGANAEHTPLVKVFMSWIFRVFGDYWFSWRFPIIVTCIVSYIAFYYIAKHFMEKRYALIATAFLTFDIMYFIHGTIYLLDMPAIMFGVLGIALYLNQKYILSAFSMALGILCKEIALLLLIALIVYAMGTNLKKLKVTSSLKSLKTPATYLCVVTLTGLLFIVWYDNAYKISTGVNVSTIIRNTVINDANGKPITTIIATEVNTFTKFISTPIEHIQFFLTYHTVWMTNFSTPYRAYQKPWNWFLPLDPNGILDAPTYFSVYVSAGDKSYTTINYRGQGTLPIWYMTVPIVALCIFQIFRRKDTEISLLLSAWIIVTTGFWVTTELIKKTTGFNYYFIYTLPALCLGIPYFWSKMPISEEDKQIALLVHLAVTVVFFFYCFPINLFR